MDAPRLVGTLMVLAGAISHTLVVTVGFDEGSTLLLAASGAHSNAWLPPLEPSCPSPP